ncbi:iron-sulfur cluster assembly protein, partial [uncultured Duncaniella sp.]|uniref:iron-sulfur cluster assembly protein n=1 Tax=uncultured Duncaniella sp. TaxID=2768039 RepID=UPI0026766D92
MTTEERTRIEERIVTMLKTVYDPEIPVDIYNLGLIYPSERFSHTARVMSGPNFR